MPSVVPLIKTLVHFGCMAVIHIMFSFIFKGEGDLSLTIALVALFEVYYDRSNR